MESKTYKCPNCGSAIFYDIDTEKLVCPNCKNEFNITNSTLDEKSIEKQNDDFNFDVYNCVSCGAILETTKNTVATYCPYCGNNVVLSDRVSNFLKPDYIIPFKVKKDDLPNLIKKYYKKKRLLPSNFLKTSSFGKVEGLYVPFWLFNGSVSGSAEFNATDVDTYRRGNKEITETKHYNVYRTGDISFDKIPVDSEVRMDDDLMESLEPYNYSDLKKFDEKYLMGFFADMYDDDEFKNMNRAKERMEDTFLSKLLGTVGGYNSVSVSSTDFTTYNIGKEYAFFPVYLLKCKYRNKEYRYGVNGQTGKVVCELPLSVPKCLIYLVLFTLLLGSVIAAIIALFAL